MAKSKTVFFCQNCGAQSAKWIGRCTSCGEWNTYVEEIIQKESDKNKSPIPKNTKVSKPVKITEVESGREERIDLNNQELNRVLGGGLVKGSLVLVGGEPGIGKSTLLLQVVLGLNATRILYVTGEESEVQIKLRASRIGLLNEECYLYAETNTQRIFQAIEKLEPGTWWRTGERFACFGRWRTWHWKVNLIIASSTWA